jgi:PPP family 3-phenylpropionic acid transporter
MRIAIVRLSALASLAGFSVFFLTTEFAGLFAAMALMAFFWSAVLPLIEGLAFAHLGEAGASLRQHPRVGFGGLHRRRAGARPFARSPADRSRAVGDGHHSRRDRAVQLRRPRGAAPPAQRGTASFGATLRRPEVRALFGACFLMSAAHGALYVFYSIFLVDHGYDKALVGWMWTLGVVAEIVVFMLMPRITQRVSLRAILLFSFACAVARFLMIGWGAGSLAVLLVAQVLHGATFGAYHAAAIAVINEWFPGRLQSRGQALYGSISFGAGGMLGGLAQRLHLGKHRRRHGRIRLVPVLRLPACCGCRSAGKSGIRCSA